MLSNHLEKELITQRVEKVVSVLMEEDPSLKEDLDYSKIIVHLANLFDKNLPFEEFNAMSDDELKDHCSAIMVVEILAQTSQEWTSEQMAIFDEAVKRK